MVWFVLLLICFVLVAFLRICWFSAFAFDFVLWGWFGFEVCLGLELFVVGFVDVGFWVLLGFGDLCGGFLTLCS